LINSVGHICYYAFDVLHADGLNARNIGLELRKPLLQEILLGSSLRYSGSIDGEPAVIAEHARKFGLEGIVAKRKTSVYESGKRSGTWIKYKLNVH
jgi:bifunctional non-homologous end joining protein LigD